MTHRMNIEFSADANELLEGLARKLGTTKAGVLRFGLSLLNLSVREEEAGNAIGVVRGERVVKEVVGGWNRPAA